jgi:NAD(P)-dependent dehydrogenase (short-subunit alcohol dehydrogenase family)
MSSKRVVVVTGGASGIGRSIVEKFLANESEVWVLDRNQPANFYVKYISVDLSDTHSIELAVEQLPEHVDVLVNAAGVSGLLPIPTVMAVNFYGLRTLTEALASRINAGGAVVNIASTSSWYWRDHLMDVHKLIAALSSGEIEQTISELISDGYTAYARSKEAVLVWSAMAAQQYLGRFRVNSVSPGPVQTPLLDDFYEAMGHEELDPLTARAGGRNGLPAEIADVVLFLASEQSRWINGTDIPVDNSAEMSEFLAAQGLIAGVKLK